jgi:transcriptional regulator with XRE-family HTH domain
MNGKLMKERRRALGMTQMQLAVAVGACSIAVVSGWERGRTVASVPKLKKLAEVLGVSMEELLEDGEDE